MESFLVAAVGGLSSGFNFDNHFAMGVARLVL
jgi:hypothetical protein